jgi:hypothetical protein
VHVGVDLRAVRREGERQGAGVVRDDEVVVAGTDDLGEDCLLAG